MQPALARLRRTRAGGASLALEARVPIVLAAVVCAAAAGRALLGTQIVAPWIFVDELLHADLARSVEEHGRFLVRGEHTTVSFLYPALIAPAWAAKSATTTYALAKLINAVLMSLAAVAVYLWGRRFLSPRGAAAGAVLTLCLPVFMLTGTLMTENAFLPASLLGLFAIALAMERPTLERQAYVFAAVALAVLTRVQGLLLVPVLVTAVLALAALERRPRRALAFWPLALAFAGAAVVYTIAKLVAGDSILALGVYEGVRTAAYSPAAQAKWLLYSAGDLALALGILPLCALAAVLGRARRVPPAERAFLAVAVSALAWTLVLGALAGSWQPVGVKERYMIHAAPPLFLALVLWLERGAPRPRLIVVSAAAAIVALVAGLPLGTLFASPALLGNDFGLLVFFRLAEAIGSVTAVRVLAALGAFGAAALFLVLPRRLTPALPAAVAVYLLAVSVPVFTTFRGEARKARALAGYGDEPSWVDAAIGRDQHAVFLNTANFEPETRQGRILERFVPAWEAEFWNRSFDGVVSLGVQEPAPLPQAATILDWSNGRVERLRARYVLVSPRYPVEGRPLARRGDLALFEAGGTVRLAAATEGLDGHGLTAGHAAYSVWARWAKGVAVQVDGATGVVLANVGTLEATPGGGARIASITGRARLTRPDGVLRLRPPAAPFRLEVAVLGRDPAARITFRLAPA
jgi:hypothetical protein